MENKSNNLVGKIRNVAVGLCIASMPLAYSGCATSSNNYAIEYGVVGAGAGAIIGHQNHHTGNGALIGGLLGTIFGSQIEK